MGEIKRETKIKKEKRKRKREIGMCELILRREKKRKIDVVRESGKLRWEKKGRHVWWERNIEMRKKKGIDMGEREEINEKKIAPISQIFPLLNYSPLLYQQNLMWNKDLTNYNNIVWCEIKITYCNIIYVK